MEANEELGREMSLSTKSCTKCHEEKEFTEFNKASHTKDGLSGFCRKCAARITRERYQSETVKAKIRNRELMRLYGINSDDYAQMLKAQGGVCAICKRLTVNGRRLCVDHNDVTHQNRLLLCDNCNKGIGCLRHSPNLLRTAADYLETIDIQYRDEIASWRSQ